MSLFGKKKPEQESQGGGPGENGGEPREVVPPSPEEDRTAEGERIKELSEAVSSRGLPDHAQAAAEREIARLARIGPTSPEYGVGLNYLDFLLDLPWNKTSEDDLSLEHAAQALDREHSCMGPVRDRILEHLAVSIRVGSRKPRVLVVDDEPIALENMSHILSREGYEVDTAPDGEQALEMLEQEGYDLVVSDLKMDRMDGMELLGRAKDTSPDTRFAIITGYATVDTAVDAMRKGAVHFLAKPIDLDQLRSLAAEVLTESRNKRLVPGTVLCFSGPPGTGKTSVGRSIAQALGRSFVRLSMAGMRDESELRGHRRTYVGAMPGRVLTEIRRAGTRNPVFMLDEMDKLGQDFRGDPASILLELLDPEQNSRFLDYYLDIPFDLSRVLFLGTANAVERLSRPLRDRLEVIDFPAYTPSEKRRIALEHLLPKQIVRHGMDQEEVGLTPEAVDRLVSGYTREAGVRNLEREVAALCRKVNRLQVQGDEVPQSPLGPGEVEALLGPQPMGREAVLGPDEVGTASATVWTEAGGEVLFVETARMPGRGELIMTGSLGEVLKESARTALSHIRSRADSLGLDPGFLAESDIHVHIPAGAVPKDGPSAGVTIAAALVSLLTDKPIRRAVPMSGELTLNGRLLAIGGIRDKILAAAQAGACAVVFPEANRSEIESLAPEVREALDILLADDLQAALDHVLVR